MLQYLFRYTKITQDDFKEGIMTVLHKVKVNMPEGNKNIEVLSREIEAI
jgi:hypothetical protein